jgi:hypothetical protein
MAEEVLPSILPTIPKHWGYTLCRAIQYLSRVRDLLIVEE